MASEVAAPPTQLPSSENMDTTMTTEETLEAPTIDGDERHIDEAAEAAQPIDSAVDAPSEPLVGPTDAVIDTKVSAPPPADSNPAGPTPIEDVAGGIQPVADFIPKDSLHLSHPTPPPDELLTTGAADVDVEMSNTEPDAQQPPTESATAQPEQSLVRPREDDAEDEPAAKRSKVEDDSQLAFAEPTSGLADGMADVPTEESTEDVTASVMETVEESGAVDSTEASIADLVAVPSQPASTPPIDPQQPRPSSLSETTAPTQPETQPPDAPGETVEDTSALATEVPVDAKPVESTTTGDAQPSAEAATASAEKPTYSTSAMTPVQKNSLVEKMKNLKKTKNSGAFLRPVDYVALNIPTYPEIVKNPMDLSTMEKKLKEGEYHSVQEFADDFDLIINNVRRFNGDTHSITQAGLNMEAYFRRMMQTVPTADMVAPPKPEKKRSPSITREKPPRRESRAPAAPAPAPAPAPSQPTETYALQPDGTPQIRRQSSNRPARAIKPPQNREIPYAKPKRKAHMLELKFCEHVLDEIRSSKHGALNHPFLVPVDPVALNIPQYRQIVKEPMDLGTMATKLKNGEYGTAKEFKADFDKVITACTTFNPTGNPVRDMAIQLQRQFQTYWADKAAWEKKHAPASNRASSASAEDESAEDEDEEEDDDDTKAATIRTLQKQLAQMQSALVGMTQPQPKKKSKSAKSGGTKKIGSTSSAPKSKAASKPAPKRKARTVTYDEKQEISESVGQMNEDQIAGLTDIITKNVAKYRNMEDMELEIDDLPNDVQVMLLDYVRKMFGNPNKKKAREPSPEDAAALDDDDFEPDRRGSGAGGNKRKKHKPMGKKEQQDAIDDIKNRLKAFDSSAISASESPTNSSFNAQNAQPDTSGDEESEESEED